jgi:Putative amidoligase enzyme
MKVARILGKLPQEEQEQNTPTFVLPKCLIGLEYEYENTARWCGHHGQLPKDAIEQDVQTYFTQHVDHSLRKAGCEFVFRGPYAGTKVENAIQAMDALARAQGYEGSYRTSLHVHLDVQQLDIPEQITLFGLVYSICEPLLYKFVGNNREDCNYCIPWYLNPQHYQRFLGDLKVYRGREHLNAESLGSAFKRDKAFKYSGLNFFSLGDFGTVEFRQAPVTMQAPKIITWINLLMHIKKFVLTQRSTSSLDVYETAIRRGAEGFYLMVFEQHFKEVTKYTKNIYIDFQKGLNTAQNYLVCI